MFESRRARHFFGIALDNAPPFFTVDEETSNAHILRFMFTAAAPDISSNHGNSADWVTVVGLTKSSEPFLTDEFHGRR